MKYEYERKGRMIDDDDDININILKKNERLMTTNMNWDWLEAKYFGV